MEIKNLNNRLTDMQIVNLLHKAGYDMSDVIKHSKCISNVSVYDFEKISFDGDY